MFRLHFFRLSSSTAVLRFSRIWRIIFFIIAAVFASLSLLEGAPVWPAIVLGAVSLVSALYSETWIFDISGEGLVTRRTGLWPLLRSIRFPVSDVASVALHISRPHMSRSVSHEASPDRTLHPVHGERRFIKLLLMRKNHAPIAVYTDLSRDGSRIMETGKHIASFIQVPFTC